MNFRQITPFIILMTFIAVLLQIGCDKLVTEKETVYINDTTLGIGCFDCHTQDDNLLIRPKNQFENSGHADYSNLGLVEDRAECRSCHTHQGFILAYDENIDVFTPSRYAGINCFTCHLPHPDDPGDYGSWDIHDLRDTSITNFVFLADSGNASDFGKSNLCANCHTVKNPVPAGSSVLLTEDFGPHNSPQGDIMSGKSSYFLDPAKFDTTEHADNGCIKCHYGTTSEADGMGNGYDFAEHTFRLLDESDSTEYNNTCNVSGCHAATPIGEFFDNDSVRTIDSIANTVASHLIAFEIIDPDSLKFTYGDTISQLKAQALFNFLMYKNDNSRGIHNLRFTTNFLDSTAQVLDSLPPEISFVSHDTNACLTDDITFTPNIIGEFDTIYWDFGNGNVLPVTNEDSVVYTYDAVGIYTVTMTAVSRWDTDLLDNSNEVIDTGAYATYTSDTLLYVDAPPIADAVLLDDTLNPFCRGDEVFFVNQSSNIIPGSYTWHFGYGDSLVGGRDISHVYDTIGDFTVSMKVETECGEDTKILDSIVRIEGAMPFLTANDTTVCLGDVVSLTNNSIDNITATHFLRYGSNPEDTATIEKGEIFPVTYASAGTYSIVLTLTTACGTELLNLPSYITVGEAKVGFASDSTTVCLGDIVSFNDSSVHNIDAVYTWDFGDGETLIDTIAGGANGDIAKLYDSIGTYDVSLTLSPDTAYGCSVVDSVLPNYITIKGAMPEFEVNDSTICKGETAIFTNNSIDNLEGNYTWDFGDGSGPETNSSATINHIYTTAGTFDVSLEFVSTDPSNCGDTILVKQAFITVGEVTVGFGAVDSTVCLGDTVFFVNNSVHNIDAVHGWTFGNNDTLVNPVVGGGDGNIAYLYDTLGVYDVSLAVTPDADYGCLEAIQIEPSFITITGAVLNIGVVNDSVCLGETVTFVNNSDNNIPGTYTWNFGDGSAPVEDNSDTVTYVYLAGAIYDVTLDFTDSSGTCTTQQLLEPAFVKVIEVDVDFASLSSTICKDDSIVFINNSVTSIPGTYTWNFGDGTAPVDNNADTVVHFYNPTGIFDVSLDFTSDDINSCGTPTMSKTSLITVYGSTFDIEASDSTACLGDTILFINNSTENVLGASSYSWRFGGLVGTTIAGTEGNSDTVRFAFDEVGTFDVDVFFTDSSNSGCEVQSLNIPSWITIEGVIPFFTFDISGLDYTFTNTSDGTIDSLKWDFDGDGTIDNTTSATPVVHTYTSGTYNAKLIVYNSNCSIIDSVITEIIVP